MPWTVVADLKASRLPPLPQQHIPFLPLPEHRISRHPRVTA